VTPPQYPQPGYAPAPQKRSPWPWILGIGCGAPALLFAGCIVCVSTAANQVAKDPEFRKSMKELQEVGKNTAAEKVDLVAGSLKITRNSLGGVDIQGAIKNRTPDAIPYLQVKFALFDKSGAQVDTEMSNTTDLAGKGTWKFKISSMKEDVANVKLISVSTSALD
jgi:hypothetical protein